MHWPRIRGLCTVSWCLAEGQWNGDQRRPMGRNAREGLYSLLSLSIMGICTDLLCPACGEEEETTFHFLGKCPAGVQDRNTILGGYILDLKELSEVNPKSHIRFARSTKRLL